MEIKNLAMSDSKGHDLEKNIAVRVTSVESKQVRIMILWKFESNTNKALFIFGYAQPKRVANNKCALQIAGNSVSFSDYRANYSKRNVQISYCQPVFDVR